MITAHLSLLERNSLARLGAVLLTNPGVWKNCVGRRSPENLGSLGFGLKRFCFMLVVIYNSI